MKNSIILLLFVLLAGISCRDKDDLCDGLINSLVVSKVTAALLPVQAGGDWEITYIIQADGCSSKDLSITNRLRIKYDAAGNGEYEEIDQIDLEDVLKARETQIERSLTFKTQTPGNYRFEMCADVYNDIPTREEFPCQ
jgi:hypothetical protein